MSSSAKQRESLPSPIELRRLPKELIDLGVVETNSLERLDSTKKDLTHHLKSFNRSPQAFSCLAGRSGQVEGEDHGKARGCVLVPRRTSVEQ